MKTASKTVAESGTVKVKHIKPADIKKLIKAAAANRWAHRDQTMLAFTYKHGLRVSELCALRWDDIDWTGKNVTIYRRKQQTATGTRPNRHPLDGDDLAALKRLYREYGDESDYVFATERRGDDGLYAPFTPNGVGKALRRLGAASGVAVCNPHALRHGCAQAMADAGEDAFRIRDALGHANVVTSNLYVAQSPARLKGRLPTV